MKFIKIKYAFLAILLTASSLVLNAANQANDYKLALDLYNRGVYDGARSLFEKQSDFFADGYVVLCAIKTKAPDYLTLLESYRRKYENNAVSDRIAFEYSRLLFDAKEYGLASLELKKLSPEILDSNELSEYIYKCAYCAYTIGEYEESKQALVILDALDYSVYSAPGAYLSGTMLYNDNKFIEAESYFLQAARDPRFAEISEYYIVDCEFNQKNYEFAISEGERLYGSAPAERRERLARMISESALVLGDIDKAKLYFEDLSQTNMNRKDYFYSGTVLYSVKDYQGAIQNYQLMENRSDSLGQIANYHIANSYLNLRNQVAAMDAFKAASEVDFDPRMTEDAFFNYAKLAFDLNKDSKGFTNYIKRYSTTTRGEQIYGYMALAALYDRDYAAAVQAYDNIEELNPEMQNNYTKANYLRGQQLFANGSYRDAIPYFRATSYYLPRNHRLNQSARYWLADSYYRCGDYSEAAKLYEDLYNADALYDMPEGEMLAYNAAYCYFKSADYANSARWFDKYINSNQRAFREDALRRRADCDFGLRDYKSAINSYKRVIDEYGTPNNIYPYYQQALSYGLNGDKKNKLATLQNVAQANADSPLYFDALYELGRTQLELKNNNDAINTFTSLNKSATDQMYKAKSLSGLGMVYRNMTKYDNALNSYKQIVSDMPGTEYAEEAMLAIESIYQTMRQPDKFLDYLEKNSLTKNKSESEREQMYFNTAEQLYLDGNYSDAIASSQKFLQNFPSSLSSDQIRFYMAESYKSLGDKEKAIDSYKIAMNSPSSLSFVETAKLRYGELSYELERFADAYNGYKSLKESTKFDQMRTTASLGMMRSAYKAKDYGLALSPAEELAADSKLSNEIQREAKYVQAKSLLGLSRRNEAMELFTILAKEPSTNEGAEANFILIQNFFDTAEFDSVESQVYSFSQSAGNQSYWLAKAYLVLGDSFTEKKAYSQAQATYESIRDGYEAPEGGDDIADNVQKRINRLNSLLEN